MFMKETIVRTSCFITTSLAMLSLAATTNTAARAATIVPKYDTTVDQKYWTADFKKQVQAVCDLLGGYISDNITIELTVTVGNTGDAFGTGAPDTTGAYENTSIKYRAKKGKITFGITSFDIAKGDWKGNNTSLMLHEIIHCLGFSSGIPAFAANIDTMNNTFKGEQVKKVNGGNPFPLNGATDRSHFQRSTMDQVNIAPRMWAGGGQLLSIVDLAALADLGYDIPVVKNVTKAIAVGFQLDKTFGSKYKMPQWGGATSLINGYAGDDTLTGDSESIALFGSGGNDTLITGSERTVMVGDEINAFAAGFATGAGDNSDIYKITSKKEHLVVGLGAKDKIIIKTGLVTADDLTKIKAELTGAYSVYTFSNTQYPTFKVTVGTLVFYVCYPLTGYPTFANPQMPTATERTAVTTALTNATTALNTRLKACVSIGN
jgi:hypothetical protein